MTQSRTYYQQMNALLNQAYVCVYKHSKCRYLMCDLVLGNICDHPHYVIINHRAIKRLYLFDIQIIKHHDITGLSHSKILGWRSQSVVGDFPVKRIKTVFRFVLAV
jgi:hypothetical protein